MNNRTEEDKARELYGKARDQLRGLDTLRWDELPADARTFYQRLVRLAVVEAIQGGNAIRRDVLEYWAAASARATKDGVVAVVVTLEPGCLQVAAQSMSGAAHIMVPYPDIMTAIRPKGAIDEIISHLLAEVRPAGEGIAFNGGH